MQQSNITISYRCSKEGGKIEGFFGLSDLITQYIAMHMQVAKCEYKAIAIMFIYFAI